MGHNAYYKLLPYWQPAELNEYDPSKEFLLRLTPRKVGRTPLSALEEINPDALARGITESYTSIRIMKFPNRSEALRNHFADLFFRRDDRLYRKVSLRNQNVDLPRGKDDLPKAKRRSSFLKSQSTLGQS